MTLKQANSASHSGDCEVDVNALIPQLKAQLDKIKPEELAAELKEYGAWDDVQLSNHADNLQRLVWIAACDISEEHFQKGGDNMQRVTTKNVEGVFELFVETIGGRIATDYNDVGAYALDYNSVYGGYNIEKCVNAGGGVTCPFGDARRNASEMFYTLHFAIRAVEEDRKNKGRKKS